MRAAAEHLSMLSLAELYCGVGSLKAAAEQLGVNALGKGIAADPAYDALTIPGFRRRLLCCCCLRPRGVG
eukprot:14507117-Alexandrium_andersonii.AAC.1